jgi:hypothetical protein
MAVAAIYDQRYWVTGCILVLLSLVTGLPALAQVSCGDPPKDVPAYIQEQLKGDAEGRAQALTRILGGLEIKGSVDASRTELYEQHRNLDQHQIDMYFMWVSCQAIMADRTLTTVDKLMMWTQVRSAFGSSTTGDARPTRNPNALYQYGDAVADVQGAVISQANGTVTFQTVHTAGKADPTREVEYQDWVLACPDLPAPNANQIVGQFSGMLVGETCHIIRKATTS